MNSLEFIISCLFVYAVIHIHRKYGTDYFKMLFKEFGIFVVGFFIITFLLFMVGILIFK